MLVVHSCVFARFHHCLKIYVWRGHCFLRWLKVLAQLNYGIQELNIDELAVNEQNPQAVGFYEHLGFKVVERSATDDQCNPYPILRMKLDKEK